MTEDKIETESDCPTRQASRLSALAADYIYEEKMKEEFRRKIDEIMAGMHCPKDFKCAATGLNQLCKARDVGLDNYLECLDENRIGCPFALSFGNGYFCQCPLRVYLAKKLKT